MAFLVDRIFNVYLFLLVLVKLWIYRAVNLDEVVVNPGLCLGF